MSSWARTEIGGVRLRNPLLPASVFPETKLKEAANRKARPYFLPSLPGSKSLSEIEKDAGFLLQRGNPVRDQDVVSRSHSRYLTFGLKATRGTAQITALKSVRRKYLWTSFQLRLTVVVERAYDKPEAEGGRSTGKPCAVGCPSMRLCLSDQR